MEVFSSNHTKVILPNMDVAEMSKPYNSTEVDKWIKQSLPPDYNFEVHKTLRRIADDKIQHVALQFPEGLLTFSTQISLILKNFTPHKLRVTIMGDVTYGACCIDDYAARAIGCDLLVHYGHSCLIPIGVTLLKCMYVFVDILFNPTHLYETLKLNFDSNTQFVLLSTIQYIKSIHGCSQLMRNEKFFEYTPLIPQKSPLTSGEVLGCTSPILHLPAKSSTTSKKPIHHKSNEISDNLPTTGENQDNINSSYKENTEINDVKQVTAPRLSGLDSIDHHTRNESNFKDRIDCAIFVADGRFHLESALIQNPTVQFYRYDPFTRKILREYYDHKQLHSNRQAAITAAQNSKMIGIVMGTLGRQGNIKIVESIQSLLTQAGRPYITLLMSEILPHKLKNIPQIDAYIQIACPRLSIDWGHHYHKPLLSPYEAFVAFGSQEYLPVYPMDFYSKGGGSWSNYNEANQRPQRHDKELDRKALLRQKLANKRSSKQRSNPIAIQYEKL